MPGADAKPTAAGEDASENTAMYGAEAKLTAVGDRDRAGRRSVLSYALLACEGADEVSCSQ